MAKGTWLKLEGAKELEKALVSIDSRVRNRTVGAALKKAAKPIVASAKTNAPSETGLLRKSITVQFKVNKRRGRGMAIIGPANIKAKKAREGLKGKQAMRNPAHYGHLVEFGTKPHFNKYTKIGPVIIPVGSWHPGTEPKPFLRAAYETHENAMPAAVKAELTDAINKAKAKGH